MTPLHLTVAATLAIHLIAAVVIDAIGVVNKEPPRPPPLRVSMVDLDTSQIRPAPEPEPEPEPEVRPEVAPTETVKPDPTQRRRPNTPRINAPRPSVQETPNPDARPTGGGLQRFRLPDTASGGRGPEVAHGERTIGPTGRGGEGGGHGGGNGGGEGSGSAPPRPLSVAAIKTKAKPKGNYDYFDAGKNYPAEARQLGVEGVIKAKLIVDEQGHVTKVTLLKPTLGHGLDELALARGRALEFDPALDADGRAVASIVIWEFTFSLPK